MVHEWQNLQFIEKFNMAIWFQPWVFSRRLLRETTNLQDPVLFYGSINKIMLIIENRKKTIIYYGKYNNNNNINYYFSLTSIFLFFSFFLSLFLNSIVFIGVGLLLI